MALAPDARDAPCRKGPRSADTGRMRVWCRGVRSRPGDPDRHKKCKGPAERRVTPLSPTGRLSTDSAMITRRAGRYSHASGTMPADLVCGTADDDGVCWGAGRAGRRAGPAVSGHRTRTGPRRAGAGRRPGLAGGRPPRGPTRLGPTGESVRPGSPRRRPREIRYGRWRAAGSPSPGGWPGGASSPSTWRGPATRRRTTYEPVRASVHEGDEVEPGEVLGVLEPPTAHCTGPCLHWGLRRGEAYLNPLSLLPSWLLWAGPSRLLRVDDVPAP